MISNQTGNSMKRLVQVFFLISTALGISGCAEPGRYPISGEECGPKDPVLDLDAADCLVPNT